MRPGHLRYRADRGFEVHAGGADEERRLALATEHGRRVVGTVESRLRHADHGDTTFEGLEEARAQPWLVRIEPDVAVDDDHIRKSVETRQHLEQVRQLTACELSRLVRRRGRCGANDFLEQRRSVGPCIESDTRGDHGVRAIIDVEADLRRSQNTAKGTPACMLR